MYAGKNNAGFTLVELMVTVVVLAIIATIALPSFQGWRERMRVRGAAEAILAHLQFARSESIKESRDLAVKITTGNSASWCLGISNQAESDGTAITNCTCSGSSPTCQFGPSGDLMQRPLLGTDFPDVSLATNSTWLKLDSVRGTDNDPDTITLTGNLGATAQVTHNRRGHVEICGNVGGAYPACP